MGAIQSALNSAIGSLGQTATVSKVISGQQEQIKLETERAEREKTQAAEAREQAALSVLERRSEMLGQKKAFDLWKYFSEDISQEAIAPIAEENRKDIAEGKRGKANEQLKTIFSEVRGLSDAELDYYNSLAEQSGKGYILSRPMSPKAKKGSKE